MVWNHKLLGLQGKILVGIDDSLITIYDVSIPSQYPKFTMKKQNQVLCTVVNTQFIWHSDVHSIKELKSYRRKDAQDSYTIE